MTVFNISSLTLDKLNCSGKYQNIFVFFLAFLNNEMLLTHEHLLTHGCALSTVATDALVLQNQGISAHNADQISMASWSEISTKSVSIFFVLFLLFYILIHNIMIILHFRLPYFHVSNSVLFST